jgi:exopolysaccharide biosynthesis protein
MILWAEGAGKVRYVAGKDSTGASLSDMAEMCAELGMVNGVNLDGGGSAQILLNNRRELRISDRYPADNRETERPVPLGLIVR